MNALLIVDVQNDFLPGGSLAVPSGDEVIPVINEVMPNYELVLATQDWHPADHGSFAEHHEGQSPGDVIDLHGLSQILWPIHCVQETEGAEFATELNTARINRVFQKGTDPQVDSYSGFFDNGRRGDTGLSSFLTEQGVEELTVAGLATDYCVKFTVLDAVEQGFETRLLLPACRGVELAPGDCAVAMDEMLQAGVEIVFSTDE